MMVNMKYPFLLRKKNLGCTSFLVGCYTNIKNDLLNFRIDIDEVFVKRVGRGDDTSFVLIDGSIQGL